MDGLISDITKLIISFVSNTTERLILRCVCKNMKDMIKSPASTFTFTFTLVDQGSLFGVVVGYDNEKLIQWIKRVTHLSEHELFRLLPSHKIIQYRPTLSMYKRFYDEMLTGPNLIGEPNFIGENSFSYQVSIILRDNLFDHARLAIEYMKPVIKGLPNNSLKHNLTVDLESLQLLVDMQTKSTEEIVPILRSKYNQHPPLFHGNERDFPIALMHRYLTRIRMHSDICSDIRKCFDVVMEKILLLPDMAHRVSNLTHGILSECIAYDCPEMIFICSLEDSVYEYTYMEISIYTFTYLYDRGVIPPDMTEFCYNSLYYEDYDIVAYCIENRYVNPDELFVKINRHDHKEADFILKVYTRNKTVSITTIMRQHIGKYVSASSKWSELLVKY